MFGSKTLFHGKSLSEKARNKKESLKVAIREEDPDRIASTDKREYVEYITSQHDIGKVKVDTDNVEIAAEEFSPTEDLELVIPVAGNTDLLAYSPKNQRIGQSIQATWDDNRLRVELRRSGRRTWDEENLQNTIDRTVEHIDTHVNRLNNQVEKFRSNIETTAEQLFEHRREEIREQREMFGNLDVPLQRDDNTPDSFTIDAPERRAPITLEPPESGAGTGPAPTVSESAYNDVLEVVHDVGIEFERSPHLFSDLNEENLRDHILFALELNFEVGTATGETFNRGGKSDILLRADDGTNVFVAECAIWNGVEYYTSKIDQLYRYLTWRDSKTAVILFVQNKRMEPVRKQIEEGAEDHDLFVEETGRPDESWWQYRFQFEDDPERELDLAVLAFHIPPSE